MCNTKPLLFLFIFLFPQLIIAQETGVEPFMPEVFKQFPNVRDFAMSPDQTEIYFTIESYKKEFSTIAFIQKNGNNWSEPQIASFSGKFKDLEPFFAPDGLSLFFASSRPLDENSQTSKDMDIWVVQRTNTKSAWSAAKHTGSAINTEKNEFYPAVTSSGNLYFTRFSEDAKRKEDIFVSAWKDGAYQAPQVLSDQVNSPKYEFNAYVSPDESFIVFTSYGRSDDTGGGDLYISTKNSEGKWNPAQHLGKGSNSSRIDYCPFVDAKNGIIYFTSERSEVPRIYTEQQSLKALQKQFNQYTNGRGRIFMAPFNLKDYQK